MSKAIENWSCIEGYDNYKISTCGRVKDTNTKRIIKVNNKDTVDLIKDCKLKNYRIISLIRKNFNQTDFSDEVEKILSGTGKYVISTYGKN
tara:strand:- start:22 stop:294 length:273 start_codon:yes stop_codon:yes gene_type:complete